MQQIFRGNFVLLQTERTEQSVGEVLQKYKQTAGIIGTLPQQRLANSS